MSAPHVLLLGGHGKVAMKLTPLLLARGWDVTSVIRNPEHEREILELGAGQKGTLDVLLSSLEDVKSVGDAQSILDRVSPDYVVWAAGAGGKGGPQRTYAVDQDAAKHFTAASFASPRVTKLLLISHLGSRRNQPPWMSDEEWARLQHINADVLPTYARAKLEADEFMTALAARRRRQGGTAAAAGPFQAINLRPGYLSDDPGTGKVVLGKTQGTGKVSRDDVADVAVRLLERDDTDGWYDLLNGDEPVDQAVERVVREKVNTVEGEDVEAMIRRLS